MNLPVISLWNFRRVFLGGARLIFPAPYPQKKSINVLRDRRIEILADIKEYEGESRSLQIPLRRFLDNVSLINAINVIASLGVSIKLCPGMPLLMDSPPIIDSLD